MIRSISDIGKLVSTILDSYDLNDRKTEAMCHNVLGEIDNIKRDRATFNSFEVMVYYLVLLQGRLEQVHDIESDDLDDAIKFVKRRVLNYDKLIERVKMTMESVFNSMNTYIDHQIEVPISYKEILHLQERLHDSYKYVSDSDYINAPNIGIMLNVLRDLNDKLGNHSDDGSTGNLFKSTSRALIIVGELRDLFGVILNKSRRSKAGLPPTPGFSAGCKMAPNGHHSWEYVSESESSCIECKRLYFNKGHGPSAADTKKLGILHHSIESGFNSLEPSVFNNRRNADYVFDDYLPSLEDAMDFMEQAAKADDGFYFARAIRDILENAEHLKRVLADSGPGPGISKLDKNIKAFIKEAQSFR